MSAATVARLLATGDVRWDGSDLGLLPHLPAEDERLVLTLDEDDIPALVDALDRPQTFVKAHVLLTRLTEVERETFPTWNGLAVDIAADGSILVDPSQRPAIVERWQRWLAQREPR
ncbi:MAG: hypothetical protein ACOH2F_08350 [Cellulomonas sp.]